MNERNPDNKETSHIEEVFLDALEYTSGANREAFLEESCRGDAALREAVEALLRKHTHATELFQTMAQGLSASEKGMSDNPEPVDSIIGPYRIIRVLGEGGGGTVYEAQQEEPLRRNVALKILNPGTDAQKLVALFETERQTLARMEHANIARAIDAGTTPDGRPYFVMDLVQGERITDFCTHHSLPINERLCLMQQVCAAVQHAHNKGVIHCDLKPSNILVTLVDGIPVPKIVDFGIARIIAQPAPKDTDSASGEQWIGSPVYMSPEQFGMPADIDIRSDVYSLGVILYELIAGRTPFHDSHSSSIGNLRRLIRETTPEPPSRYYQGADLFSNGELDCIVLKTLEKDRENRYPTVQAFSSDIGHFLKGDPVDAHQSGHLYRLKKLMLRNRLASAAIALSALTLLVGFVTSTLLYLRANAAEREQARLRTDAEEREHVTRAAILLMQGRPEEADAEVSRMGGLLTQPSLEATNVFRQLASWNAENNDWKKSADLWLALSRVNRFDDSDMTDNATRDLVPLGPALVTVGDFARYHDLQDLLLERLGRTNNPIAAEHVLKLCLQIPASAEMMEQLRPVLKVAADSLSPAMNEAPPSWLDAWRCVAVGLCHYREGHYDEAIAWCTRALMYQNEEISRDLQAQIIRGMAKIASGDRAGGRTDLDAARIVVNGRFRNKLEFYDGGYWHDWLDARILLAEADTRLNAEP